MEQCIVPPQLPALLLPHQVLLPTGFCKLTLNGEGTTRRTAALLEYLGSGEKDIWVAILPDSGSKEAIQDDDGGAVRSVPRDKLGSIATAARVLQLSRLVQTGDWVVLLEGVCRVRLDALLPADDPEEEYDCVEVTQLELCAPRSGSRTAGPSHSPIGSATAASSSSDASSFAAAATSGASASDSASLQELGKQLKSATRALLRQLARSMGGAQPSRRVLELLNTVPAWRAADVVAAALSSNYHERLAVLKAVDHKQRVRLALQVAQAALDAMQQAAGSTGSSSSGSSVTGPSGWGRAGRSGKGTGLGSLAMIGRESGMAAADDDDPDGLDALMARLAAAKPPPEVAKAAAKEYRRLRQSGENQPGFAAARAYLETLADLPWSRTAADLAMEERAAAAATAGSTSSSNAGAGASSQTGHTGTPHGGVAGPVPGSSTRSSHGIYGHTVAHGTSFGRTSSSNSSSSAHAGGEHAPVGSASKGAAGAGAGNSAAKEGAAGGAGLQGGPHPAVPQGVPLSLRAARELLDQQHYGLDKIKDRVVEYLAVLRLKGSHTRAPILCFIGPPGVGKTSLARSVAEVLGRPFVRIALGGVRDEAEVRGHRRTYVGAMPGRVVSGLRRARCCDPVMLLDELDKLGKDSVRGDPSAALLEVLDPEQNSAFVDAYLGLPCDLSRVTFVATANRAQDIPAPLLDRLEVVSLSGYTLEEKVHIGRVHLVPKALADHGLGAGHVHFPDSVLEFIAERYTREAGVRNLARNLAAVCRHVAVSIVSEHEASAGHTGSNQGSLPATGGAAASAAAQQQVTLASAIGRASSAAGHNHISLAPPTAPSSTFPSTHQLAPYCDGHSRAAAAGGLSMSAQPAGGDEGVCHAADGMPSSAPHTTSAAMQLSMSLMDSMSLAGLSEAPLDSLWAVSKRASSSSGGAPPAAASSSKPSGQRGIMSKLRGGTSKAAAAADHRLQLASSTALSPPAWDNGSGAVTGSPPGSGSSKPGGSWLFSWGKSSNSSHPSGSSSSNGMGTAPGGLPGWFGRGGAGQAAPVPAGVAPPVPYHGLPPSLPYPPDLLQQHGAVTVTCELVEAVLGPPRFDGPGEGLEAVALPGAAAGLVWTSVGGSVQYIECARISYGAPGRPGTLTLTGQVGEVLEESARIALSWIRAHAVELGLASSPTTTHRSPPPLLDAPSDAIADGVADSEVLDGLPAAPLQARKRGARRAPADNDDTGSIGFAATARPQACGASRHAHGSEVHRCAAADGDAVADEGTPAPEETRVVTAPVPAGMSLASAAAGASPALTWDLHVHLPAGAIPKDGPSAGITLAVALVSLLSGRAVRADTAMTGELTLRGLVLPVGGIKEKLLAARHAGLQRVLIPARNMRDVVAEVPHAVRAALTIIPVDRLEQVLAAAFDPPYVLSPPPPIMSRL